MALVIFMGKKEYICNQRERTEWYKYICMRQYSAIINILEVSATRKGSVEEANTELSVTAPTYVCVINVTQDKAYFFHTQKTDQMSVTFEGKTELAAYSVQEKSKFMQTLVRGYCNQKCVTTS